MVQCMVDMWLVIGSNSISELLFFVVLLGVSLNKQLFKCLWLLWQNMFVRGVNSGLCYSFGEGHYRICFWIIEKNK